MPTSARRCTFIDQAIFALSNRIVANSIHAKLFRPVPALAIGYAPMIADFAGTKPLTKAIFLRQA
jgi:hypothetical protein